MRGQLEFGLNVPIWVTPAANPVETARAAEELGFDFVSANDHLHGLGARYETWTMLAWMAAATSRIRIASRVLAVPYRNPAVLAKMAETFDRLSGGRLILGLGAGASEEEFRAYGIGEATIGQRITALEEAVRIIRGLWTQHPFSFGGSFHRTDAAELDPKPAHPIPIWLGMYGPRGLDLTGRLADGWIASLELAPPDRAPAMIARIRRAASEAGRDPADIALVCNLEVSLDRGPAAVAEELAGLAELGFDAFNLIVIGDDPRGDTERLALDVLPALRSATPSAE
jgi:probable F420-dependent oxidoreductase